MLTLIIGNHPRHLYFADKMAQKFPIENLIIQRRQNFLTNSYYKKTKLTKIEKLHFIKRQDAEKKFFGKEKDFLSKFNKIIEIDKEDLKNGRLKKKLKKFENKNLISYGCNIIDNDILKMFSKNTWNIHAGLSPWYRGSATHFWPTYLLEPEYTGMTVHDLTDKIDGGNIIHQGIVNLNPKDGIHENSCRCLFDFFEEILKLLDESVFKKKVKGIVQKSTGRIWTQKMWHPKLLEVIYGQFNDRINEFCFKGKHLRPPKIETIF
tara:strand:+ start:1319 stop:2110 length:792 start_codon:yes stop_codon:yes gene_type:complete